MILSLLISIKYVKIQMVVTITKYSLQILLVFHFYIVYNVKLDYIIKNTSWLPHPVFEPRTIFM